MFSKTQYTIILTLTYMLGIIAYFKQYEFLFSILLCFVTIYLLFTNKISKTFSIIMILVFVIGNTYTSNKMKKDDLLKTLAPADAVITGQVSSIPTTTHQNKTKFFLNATNIRIKDQNYQTKSKTYVTIEDEKENYQKIKIGDEIQFFAKLRIPQEATNPSQFSYRNYLKNFNTFTTAYVPKNAWEIKNSPQTTKWKAIQQLNILRQKIISKHNKIIKTPNLEILGGVVFGDDAISPPEEIKSTFIQSGLMHILAASGLNVALIFGIWFFIFSKLKLPYKFGITTGIFLIIIYTLMTGLGPPVLRAALMLTFALIGKLINRDADNIALLLLVAAILLIHNPSSLFDVGFQLSFTVTLALLTFCPLLAEKTKGIPQTIAGALYVPIIAQIAIAPIQMFYFNNFAIYSVFANICSIPLVSAISFMGFISSIFAAIPKFPDLVIMGFDYIMNPILSGLVYISNFFANLPNSLLTTTQLHPYQIVLYYSILICIFIAAKCGLTKKLTSFIVITTLSLILSFIPFKNTNLEAIFFNVGNADAILVKTPNNKQILIDTARLPFLGNYSAAKSIIYEYLKDNGIKEIDYLILTHFDADHAGGAITLMNLIKINNLVISPYKDDDELSITIPQYAKEKGINIIYPNKEKTLETYTNGEMKIFQSNNQKLDSNNLSVITTFTLNGTSMLFAGDAEIDVVKSLPIPQKIDIFKVGHHGAENTVTTEFLNNKNVKAAILSTGPSAYNHPTPNTVKSIQKSNAILLRTDTDNAIKTTITKKDIKIYLFQNKGWKTHKVLKNYV